MAAGQSVQLSECSEIMAARNHCAVPLRNTVILQCSDANLS